MTPTTDPTEVHLADLTARLAAAAGIDGAPVVRVKPAPWGARRSSASLSRRPVPTLTVTGQALTRLPGWRIEAVLAHELGHLGQDRRRVDRAAGCVAWGLLASGVAAAMTLMGLPAAGIGLLAAVLVTAIAAAVFVPESKRLEYDADRFGARLVGSALADHLDLVAGEHHELPAAFHLFVAHPPSRRRAARLRAAGRGDPSGDRHHP